MPFGEWRTRDYTGGRYWVAGFGLTEPCKCTAVQTSASMLDKLDAMMSYRKTVLFLHILVIKIFEFSNNSLVLVIQFFIFTLSYAIIFRLQSYISCHQMGMQQSPSLFY